MVEIEARTQAKEKSHEWLFRSLLSIHIHYGISNRSSVGIYIAGKAMTAELSARLRDLGLSDDGMSPYVGDRNLCREAADALDANARELTGAREETAHHIRLNADLRLNNADLKGHANTLAARIAELERALDTYKSEMARSAKNLTAFQCGGEFHHLCPLGETLSAGVPKLIEAYHAAIATLDTKEREG